MHRDEAVRRLRAAGCVFAEDEADLLVTAAATDAALADLVRRRVDGEPLEHVVGWAEFCGRRVVVEPGVFVPRQRTELMAREAVSLARPGGLAVELCCGAAAVASVLLAEVPGLEIWAVDVDPRAVRCARRNLPGVPADHVREGDLFAPLPAQLRGRVDVLVANVPYVPTDQIALMPAEARLHEPRAALDGGADGLDVLRRVAVGSPRWLAPGGRLLVETSRRQAAVAADAFATAGLRPRVVRDEDLDATVLVGRPGGARPVTP